MFDRMYIEEAKERLDEILTLAGWVTRTRELRNISFIILRDKTGEIQITVKDDYLRALVSDLGREDVISIKGKVVSSSIANAGVEFVPESIKVLNKAKQPLPFDLFGKVGAEIDTRLNYRFMDFRTPKTNAIFRIQSILLTSFRRFLTDRDYLEFQPPCVIASASEGGADLFRLPYFEKEAFLAQSPQLYKQMAAISFEKVYTVTPIWRAEKFNTPTHLNEVRQMDIEQAFADDETVMKVLEEILVYMLREVREMCPKELEQLSREITVPKLPLRRITYTEAVEMLQEAGEDMVWGDDFSKLQERSLMELVGEEAFLMKDWPSVQKAFYAMPYEENPDIVHAFDLVYNGVEISSGTQRVHIPELLREQLRKKGLNPENFTHYIESFSYGAPPHAGWSIGLERLTMTVTGMENIRECCMFPRDRDRLVP
ncbi:MAG: aspartate--tRNA(Asn) ligase [Candidatus Bathyarchaeota archaeon]